MGFHNLFFKAIDAVYERPQNGRKCTRFSGIEFDVKTDIVYESSPPEVCRLDVYRAKDCICGKKLPVLFYLHGGGFVAGDKYHRRAFSKWVATQGYAVVNVNYALGPQYKFPVPQTKLVSALNWVKDHAEEFGFDLSRVCVGGDSAGAYYASVLACIVGSAELQNMLGVHTQINFGAALLNCGVYDMELLVRKVILFDAGRKVFKDMTGINASGIPLYRWNFLFSVPDIMNKSFPSTLLIHSEKDILCVGQAEAMLSALREKGIQFREYKSTRLKDNHCFSLMWKGRAAEECNAIIKAFLSDFSEGRLS